MRILVTGASGLVGSRAVVRLREHHEVHGTFHAHRPDFLGHPKDRLHASDITDLRAFKALLDRVAPDLVLHCAAFTNVDACETAPEEARRTNVAPVEELAKWARPRGSRVILMSTDYVFDGTSPPYEVDALANPLCVYSATKAKAEMAVRALEGSLIARSTVIFGMDFGHQKRNFATWLISELSARRRVRVVDDQWSTPTLAEMIAEFLDRAAERSAAGVIHAASSECLSRFEFARRIAARFALDATLITPVKTAELNQPARRPLRPCMSVRRTEAALDMKAWSIAQSLDLLHRQLAAGEASVLRPWW